MTHSTRTHAPNRRSQLLIGGVVALAVIVSLLSAMLLTRKSATAADDPAPSPTPVVTPKPTETPEAPEPSESPVQTPVPSEPTSPAPVPTQQPSGPAPVVRAPDGTIPPGSIVRVIVEGLRLREDASTDSAQRLVFSRGALVLVGPYPGYGVVEADGYTWVPVRDLQTSELPAVGGEPLVPRGPYGWVAAGDAGTDFVEVLPARCVEGEVDLTILSSMSPWEHLACFGDRSITLEGTFGCGGCGGIVVGHYEPSWLATPMDLDFLSVDAAKVLGPVTMHWSPDGPERPPYEYGSAPILRVTGHFDDPASAECVFAPGEPPVPIDDDLAELVCRERFVVDSYEIIGTHEGFPFS